MTFKELIRIEDAASEVWVISPYLYYDIDDQQFSEMVSVNLGQKTKYKYIVPATKSVLKNIELYKKKYAVTELDIDANFLILPENDFIPFVLEIAIYDANTHCTAFAAPAIEGNNEVIKFKEDASKAMASEFREIWKKYKRTNL